jgi:NADPH:quinone reductase-like Zn-dependent oxidoreductase
MNAVNVLNDYITALLALERKVNINEDDIIVINIGMSGISMAALDLAVNVFRAKVWPSILFEIFITDKRMLQ